MSYYVTLNHIIMFLWYSSITYFQIYPSLPCALSIWETSPLHEVLNMILRIHKLRRAIQICFIISICLRAINLRILKVNFWIYLSGWRGIWVRAGRCIAWNYAVNFRHFWIEIFNFFFFFSIIIFLIFNTGWGFSGDSVLIEKTLLTTTFDSYPTAFFSWNYCL